MWKYLKYIIIGCLCFLHVGVYAQKKPASAINLQSNGVKVIPTSWIDSVDTTIVTCWLERTRVQDVENGLRRYETQCARDSTAEMCSGRAKRILNRRLKRASADLAACQSKNTKQSTTSTSTSTNKNGNRSVFGDTPNEILHNIVKDANAWGDPIQDTALNSVSRIQWPHPSKYRLANTFDSIRQKSGIYLDRLFYIGLSVAVILIIRNGLQLVIGKDINDVRKPLTNVVVGVAILTGVYVIIKLITSLVALIFNL